MPQYNGPYKIITVHPESSTYTLDLPNNAEFFPSHELQRPGPIVTNTGTEGWEIEHILDKRP
ncbi:hypothetical protein BDR04DRAFT_1106964 [Suillus decipiens]|nr:hypothetical protein BDR04DRAFT_1106964 [Suillus decipiens]